MIIASSKNPPRPNGSRIVIQKLRVVKYHVWRNMDTRGELIGASGDVGGTGGSAAGETSCIRFHDKRKECSLAVELVSASGVRVSTVEMSMR